MKYLIDSDVFIDAKNRHYGFDLCPGFWEWLDQAHTAGIVHSVVEVKAELVAGGNELADWARARPPEFFVDADATTIASLRTLTEWATANYTDAGAVATFLNAADSHLVACAHAGGLTVVTHEIASDSKKKIKIPNACTGLGVAYCTPYAMLRTGQARFILDEDALVGLGGKP